MHEGFQFNLSLYAVGFRNFVLGVTGAAVIITALALWLPELRPFRALVLQASAGGAGFPIHATQRIAGRVVALAAHARGVLENRLVMAQRAQR